MYDVYMILLEAVLLSIDGRVHVWSLGRHSRHCDGRCCETDVACALHTHGSINAQIEGMLEAWDWRADDRILHTLPLHHVHGIVNALLCAHSAGACVEFLPAFSPTQVWEHLMVSIPFETSIITSTMSIPLTLLFRILF
jgi:hypothetical protein